MNHGWMAVINPHLLPPVGRLLADGNLLLSDGR